MAIDSSLVYNFPNMHWQMFDSLKHQKLCSCWNWTWYCYARWGTRRPTWQPWASDVQHYPWWWWSCSSNSTQYRPIRYCKFKQVIVIILADLWTRKIIQWIQSFSTIEFYDHLRLWPQSEAQTQGFTLKWTSVFYNRMSVPTRITGTKSWS